MSFQTQISDLATSNHHIKVKVLSAKKQVVEVDVP